MKKVSHLLVLVLLLAASQAHALQVVTFAVGGALAGVAGTVGSIAWGPTYSASKGSGTFPTAVKEGDKTTYQAKKTVFGVQMNTDLVLGARAEAQTFLANDDSYENIADSYPMLSAAVEEANRQAAAEGVAIDPYSLAESIANYTE